MTMKRLPARGRSATPKAVKAEIIERRALSSSAQKAAQK
jgi:hypothetical protein